MGNCFSRGPEVLELHGIIPTSRLVWLETSLDLRFLRRIVVANADSLGPMEVVEVCERRQFQDMMERSQFLGWRTDEERVG